MSTWRLLQKENFTKIEELLDFLEIEPALRASILKKPSFALNLPRRLAAKIAKNSLEDPILRQFVPLEEEQRNPTGFVADPVSDTLFRKGKKLLVKYEGRALLLVSSACAMHCRYCFRQNFDYELETKEFEEEIALLKENSSLSEIILSGGDPLSLSNTALQSLIEALDTIPHLKRLRFHTRFPIGIPERIDEEFLGILDSTRLQTVFIIHCNHPRELDEEVLTALRKIQRLGIPVLNQGVLLKGVNDDLETLHQLFETLANHGILPYYLHQLDRVQGSAHFEVSEEQGADLMRALTARLSGYAVPKYVREVGGQPSKTTLMQDV
jgi:EF-P beta-lysylation protein EpmB